MMTKQKIFSAALVVLTVVSWSAYAAPATPLEIRVDHGTPLSLGAPATSVFIANPEIADVQVMSPTSIMIFGKRTGETSFMATDSTGHTLSERTIYVVQDLAPLRTALNHTFPGNKIKVESVPNGIVLMGEAKDAATITDIYRLAQRYIPAGSGDIINRVHVVGSNQIMIRVRFAEVAHNIDNSLGFSWQNIATVGGFAFGMGTGAITSTIAGGTATRPSNSTLGQNNGILGLSRAGEDVSVNGIIDALEQDGLITILAEPNLTAMSGETANFLAGGEFPIPVPQGNGSVSITYKTYGISLAFTPTLIGENRINLHVRPEVSQITTTGSITLSNISVPAISTRRAETTVEVASGQSFAVAGLINNDQSQTVNKYPFLGDLPVLGPLFRSDRFKNNQTELVIIITPYIVRPTGEELALPTDGYSPPTEMDRLLGMRHSASDPTSRTMSGKPTAIKALPPVLHQAPELAPADKDSDNEAPKPAEPVETAPSVPTTPAPTVAPPAPAAAPVAPVSQMPTSIKTTATAAPMALTPVGPGGFTLE